MLDLGRRLHGRDLEDLGINCHGRAEEECYGSDWVVTGEEDEEDDESRESVPSQEALDYLDLPNDLED